MKDKRFKIVLVILILVLGGLAIITESVYFSDFEYLYRTKKFNRILAGKEQVLEDFLDITRSYIGSAAGT